MMRVIFLSLVIIMTLFAKIACAKTLTPFVYNKLQTAQKLLAEDQVGDAKTVLHDVQKNITSDFAKAVVWQMLGRVAMRNDDYPVALEYFLLAAEQNVLEPAAQQSLMHGIGQLYCGVERWLDCQVTLIHWMETNRGQVKTSDYIMLAQAFMATEDWSAMIGPLEKAIKSEPVPQINWYRMLVAAHAYLEAWQNAIEVQKQLLSDYPAHPEEWRRLSSYFSQMGDDKSALGVSRIAFNKGLTVEPRDYKQLASLFNQNGMPHQAALTLRQLRASDDAKTDIASVKLEAELYYHAKDFDSASKLYRMLLALEGDERWVNKLIQVYVETQDWSAIENLLNLWLETHSNYELDYMLAISLVNQHKYDLARARFAAIPETHFRWQSVSRWLTYIDKVNS
jgi:tetratricopeptide (TPR) repeat protein